METVFMEAVSDQGNHGKFMLGRFSQEEWARRTRITLHGNDVDGGGPMLKERGWAPGHLLIVDLQTGEGALFHPGGSAKSDLNKTRVWVCPLFEPWLTWLYTQDLSDLASLPAVIELTGIPMQMAGYRRTGEE